jgi:hypothetical protein
VPSFSGAPNRISSRVAALLENWPGHLRKLQNLHNFSAILSHLESTLPKPLGCVDPKPLTKVLSCLAATLRKNRGEGAVEGKLATGSFPPCQTGQNFGASRVSSVWQPSTTRLQLRNPAACAADIWIVELLIAAPKTGLAASEIWSPACTSAIQTLPSIREASPHRIPLSH